MTDDRNPNREVLQNDRSAMTRWNCDWKKIEFRNEYFEQLDDWHKGGAVGPMQEWMLWAISRRYKILPELPEKKPKLPALAR